MGHGRVYFQFDFGHSFISAAESHFRGVRKSHGQGHRGNHQEWDVWRFSPRFLDHRWVYISSIICSFPPGKTVIVTPTKMCSEKRQKEERLLRRTVGVVHGGLGHQRPSADQNNRGQIWNRFGRHQTSLRENLRDSAGRQNSRKFHSIHDNKLIYLPDLMYTVIPIKRAINNHLQSLHGQYYNFAGVLSSISVVVYCFTVCPVLANSWAAARNRVTKYLQWVALFVN